MFETELSGGSAGTETEATVTEEVAENSEGEQQPEKPKRPGFQRKLERKEAELAATRAEKDRLVAELERLRSPQRSETNGKPVWGEKEETNAEYFERLAEWKLDQKLDEKERKSRDAAEQSERAAKLEAYNDAADKVRDKYPDFDEVINAYPKVPNKVLDALLDSTPEVAYYLATHEDEAEDIIKMSPVQIHKAFAKIEAKLDSSPAVKVSKAPPPIKPVGKGSSGSTKKPADMSLAEYKKWRAGK